MENIHSTIVELGSIFKQLAEMVQEQEEQVVRSAGKMEWSEPWHAPTWKLAILWSRAQTLIHTERSGHETSYSLEAFQRALEPQFPKEA